MYRRSRTWSAALSVTVLAALVLALFVVAGSAGSATAAPPGSAASPSSAPVPSAATPLSPDRGPASAPAAAPTLSDPGISPAAISLSWTNPDDLFFESYTISVSTAGATGPFSTVDTITSADTTTYAAESLSPGTTYWWEVTANVYLGSASTSNVLEAAQPTVAYLWSPVVTTSTVQLNWTDNATYGGLDTFGSFTVFERTGTGTFTSVYTTTNEGTRSTTITGLVAGGSYAFYLETSDCAGCTSASATPSNTLTAGTVLTLSASVSVDPTAIDAGQSALAVCTPSGGESPFTFAWSINSSASTAGNQTLGVRFAGAGLVTIGCTVTDAQSDEASGAVSLTVNADPAVFASLNRTSVDVGQSISFACTSTGGTGTVALGWTFGDGDSATGADATHAYAAAGTYVAGCTGVDSAGFSVASDVAVTVSPSLAATASVSSRAAAPGTTLTFTAVPVNGSGTYSAYAWNFDDGATLSGRSVAYAFPSAGAYAVTVTVTDSNDASSTATVSVTVAPIEIHLLADPTSATGGKAVTFRANATGGAGGYNYTWTFGDGSVGYGANVSHTYAGGASYTPRLTVTDRLGATNATALPTIGVATAPGPLAGVPLWLLLVVGAIVGAVLAIVVFARTRSAENDQLSALSRWVPPVGPKGAVHGTKTCPRCGASNPSLRRTCQVCGATLPRNPDR